MALTQQDKEEMYQYLITRGKSLGSLEEGDSNLSNKYLAPVLEYSGGTASKVVRLAVSLLQGKSAVLRKSGDLVQWQLQGASTWETLYSMADYKGLPGANGKNPVFRKNAANLEYKLDGEEDTAYKLLVALSDITGPEGDHVVLRVQDGKLEYKQSKAADSTYQLLVALSDITGPQGRPGKDFQILGYYDTVADLRTAITSPEPGEAYGVGTAAPYPIYIWDAVSQDWVNNGAIQGPAGRSGKSARVNTDTGYWEEFDDDMQTWKQTEALGVYNIATSEKDGLMSKDDKAKLDQMKGGDIEVSKANIEKVFTGNITTHTHDTVRIVSGMPTDVWDGVTVSTALAGSGTVDDPYLIQSCADYIHFYRNPNLYSHPFEEATPEMIANLKQIKFTSNLDFNNIEVDFGDTVPDVTSGASENMLALCYIDGQGCNISNVNFTGTWAVIPIAIYCVIKNIHIISGFFTIPLDVISTKGYLDLDSVSPWGINLSNIVTDISFVAELKFKGDIETQFLFIPGAIFDEEIFAILNLDINGGYFFSNVKYSLLEDFTNVFILAEIPACIAVTSKTIVGYDLTVTTASDVTEPIAGLNVVMYMDFAGEPYTIYIDPANTIPFYDSSTTPFHTAKTTVEMKSPEFLALLNGNTETFVADTENINDGYPVFKPNKVEQVVYDGYVAKSEFDQFKKGQGAGSDNVYKLDIDLTGTIANLTSEQQTAFYGRTYVAPTSDNIVELLGGVDGIRKLYNDFTISKTKKVIIVPTQYFYYPGYSFATSVAVVCESVNDAGEINDDTYVYIILRLSALSSFFSISIEISHFNTANQAATFSSSECTYLGSSDVLDYLTSSDKTKPLSANQGRVLKELIDNFSGTTVENSLTSSSTTNALSAAQGKALKTLVDGKVGSSEITTIKKLTQSAYDALSTKDSKTLYIIA